jgi:predicted SnoaL-like aldol condensation-catalyzing enzyme
MDNNKELVIKLLTLAFKDKDVKSASDLITDRYIQHNPIVPTGKQGFIEGLTAFYKSFPNLKWELKKIWVEDDYVIAHSHYRLSKNGNGNSIVDIFRIKDGKADEHWDISQEIPDKMAHSNGMF